MDLPSRSPHGISDRRRARRATVFLALALLALTSPPTVTLAVEAQEDSGYVRHFDWIAYPYLFTSPETGLAFGGGGIAYFPLSQDSTVKMSTVTPSFYYSTTNQYDVTIIPELYFGHWLYLYSYFSFGDYIDKFYGYGPDSPEIENAEYRHQSRIILLNVQPAISKRLRMGLYMRWLRRVITDERSNPYLLNDAVTGAAGGNSFGVGFAMSRDTRNHRFDPYDGLLAELRGVYYPKALGSDFDYNKYEADLRWYSSLGGGENHILGVQFLGIMTFGDPPFYDGALLGGKQIMRGYYLGRYRDNKLLAVQAEYRTQLFWRIAGVAFLGMGNVAERIPDFRVRTMLYSGGLGLRYKFDLMEKIYLRLDVGWGKSTSGVYFDVLQAF